MFLFFNRNRSRRLARRRPEGRRLRFESLEGRYVLSAVPVIDSFVAVEEPYGGAALSGHVVDEAPEGLTVTFTGALQGTATVDANGNFSASVSGAQLGTVSATVVDGEGQQSQPATADLTSNVPQITSLTVLETYHGEVNVMGSVSDEFPEGLTVTIDGVIHGSATVGIDGEFLVTITGEGQLGTVSATVADWFGQQSAAATATITSDAPEIVGFSATVDAVDQLYIEGTVSDEDPEGLAVIVTWLGQSYTTWADYSGFFSWSTEVQAGQEGYASAQTTDWWGQDSNEPEVYVIVY